MSTTPIRIFSGRPPKGLAVSATFAGGERSGSTADEAATALVDWALRAAKRERDDAKGEVAINGSASCIDSVWYVEGEVVELVPYVKHGPIPMAEQHAARERPSLALIRPLIHSAILKAERNELDHHGQRYLLLLLADAVDVLVADRLEAVSDRP